MKQIRSKSRRQLIIFVLVFCAMIALFCAGISHVVRLDGEQKLDLVKQSIKRAAVECYAIEGIYPSGTEYLEENYGLVIDESKYFVLYECFASNLMPDIEVYQKE